LATGEGATLRIRTALETRTYVRYRSAWLRGLIASLLIVVVTLLGLVLIALGIESAAWFHDHIDDLIAGGRTDQAEFVDLLNRAVPISLARTGFVILAVLFFAAWLSRVVGNIPALGGGTPSTSSRRAFIYSLIPIVNLIKVPGIVQDALYRVDPKAGGFFMVVLAWFGLVGSWIAGTIAHWAIYTRLVNDLHQAGSRSEAARLLRTAFDLIFGVEVVTELLVALGSLVLVIVMIRIERRSRARDLEIRQGAAMSPVRASLA
jgi:hypothetical protein